MHIRQCLQVELEQGLITGKQLRIASSAWRQMPVKPIAIPVGKRKATGPFFQVCGELSHKERQCRLQGDEGGNQAEIAALRKELAHLSSRI